MVSMRLPRITSKVLFTLFFASLVWSLLVITAPLMVPAHTLPDLSGVVGGHENEDKFSGLSLVPHAIYWLGDAECHQIANRSFFLNGNQMPFCARDVGLFAGFPIGLAMLSFRRLIVNPILVLVGLVPIGIDGGLQLVTSYESNNPLRLTTGLIAGITFSVLIAQFVFAVQEDRRKASPAPPGETV
jgi:uncharacterized membrane protein